MKLDLYVPKLVAEGKISVPLARCMLGMAAYCIMAGVEAMREGEVEKFMATESMFTGTWFQLAPLLGMDAAAMGHALKCALNCAKEWTQRRGIPDEAPEVPATAEQQAAATAEAAAAIAKAAAKPEGDQSNVVPFRKPTVPGSDTVQ